jgi:hypothetical protein
LIVTVGNTRSTLRNRWQNKRRAPIERVKGIEPSYSAWKSRICP